MVPSPDKHYKYAFAHADGHVCCLVNNIRHVCSPCKGAYVERQARLAAGPVELPRVVDELHQLLRHQYGGLPVATAVQLALAAVRPEAYDVALAKRKKGGAR
jgi:hypothetical protein